MANPNYRGKVARLATDWDRWLARVQYRAKFNQRAERLFGEIAVEDPRGRWDPVEERYLSEDEL